MLKNVPAKKPTIISIHLKIFFKAKPIAYPSSPAKEITFDNKTSLLVVLTQTGDIFKYPHR